jgi:hypothetical protein
MSLGKRQAGFSFALLAVIVLVIVAAYVAVKVFERGGDDGARGADTRAKFKRDQDALVAFVAQNQRLPCPADPSTDGDEAPPGGNAVCASPTGTLPWKTIGSSRDDAYDSWGNRISYRVFSGATGLTQPAGASMVNCDTNNLNPVTLLLTPTPSSLAPGGLCGLSHDHTTAQYLSGKGLQLNDFGTIRTDIAYVLISHGPTGLGAYTSAGTQKPLPTNVFELANINTTTPAGQFVAQASSPAGTDPSSPAHFDDLLAFQGIAEMVAKANLGARDWAENFVIGSTMDNPTVGAALGLAPGTSVPQGDLGATQIAFAAGAVTVRGFEGGTSQDIAFDTTGGAPALGVAGNGGNLLSSANSDSLRIDLGPSARKLGLALAHFGTFVVAGTTFTEQVDVTFSGGAGTVDVIRTGCHPDGGVATLSIDPGTPFNVVGIQPIAAIPSGISALGLADFKACDPSSIDCFSNLATTINSCSKLMSSVASEYARVTFAAKQSKFGLTLNDFGTFSASSTTFAERVQLTFFDDGVAVGTPIVKSACNPDGGLASYAFDFGVVEFNSVEMRPISALPTLSPQSSSFELASFVACPAGAASCPSSLAAPSNNCP